MPYLDGTGPWGTGPHGRRLGPCGAGRYENFYGNDRYYGGRFGWHRFHPHYGLGIRYNWPLEFQTPENEKEFLEKELQYMDEQKENLQKRLKDLAEEK